MEFHGEKKLLESSGDRVVMQETFRPENPIETMISDAFGQYRKQSADVGTSQASQAQLVFYVDDIVNKGWSVAVHLKPEICTIWEK